MNDALPFCPVYSCTIVVLSVKDYCAKSGSFHLVQKEKRIKNLSAGSACPEFLVSSIIACRQPCGLVGIDVQVFSSYVRSIETPSRDQACTEPGSGKLRWVLSGFFVFAGFPH
jgi:hypothetical protein